MYPFASARHVSRTDRLHIERWLWTNRGLFSGKTVLDYGCGKQPYREIVEKVGGTYHGYDDPSLPDSQVTEPVLANVMAHYDVILCNQVLTLTQEPTELLRYFREHADVLLLTVSAAYRQFHKEDKWRWTADGLRVSLMRAGFQVINVEPTWKQRLAIDYEIVMGLGAVARP